MIYLSICTGKIPKSRKARGDTHMAVVWFERPSREPFTQPTIAIGGVSADDARRLALDHAKFFRGRGEDTVETLPAEWARAHRFRLRGVAPWPEQRAARKAADDREEATWRGRALLAEARRKENPYLASLTSDELMARMSAFRDAYPGVPTPDTWFDLFAEYKIRHDDLFRRAQAFPRDHHGRFDAGASVGEGAAALRTLGLAPNATARDVRRAWHEAARKTHPDRGGTVAAFQASKRAYDAALRHVEGRGA